MILKIPSIACEVCAKTITIAIKNVDPLAEVNIDVGTKIVEINSHKTLEVIQQAIIEAGHTPASE